MNPLEALCSAFLLAAVPSIVLLMMLDLASLGGEIKANARRIPPLERLAAHHDGKVARLEADLAAAEQR
jgi:hypothetical protein